jgi:hypothetical protein
MQKAERTNELYNVFNVGFVRDMTFNSVMESWKDDRRSGCLSALRVKYLRIIQISPDQRLPARDIMEFVGISVGECSGLKTYSCIVFQTS